MQGFPRPKITVHCLLRSSAARLLCNLDPCTGCGVRPEFSRGNHKRSAQSSFVYLCSLSSAATALASQGLQGCRDLPIPIHYIEAFHVPAARCPAPRRQSRPRPGSTSRWLRRPGSRWGAGSSTAQQKEQWRLRGATPWPCCPTGPMRI